MKIAIGADDAGFHLKEIIKSFLQSLNVDFDDFGPADANEIDYPDIGFAVAKAIADGKYDRGILICGTGIGMAITADKVAGVRAALCHDTYSAERAVKSNNAQVLTMGARVIGPELAKQIVKTWLSSEFDGGKSARKVQKIIEGERTYLTGKADDPACTCD
ncbi:MAG: ribose 5-phosphate isomerase B [Alicyclobacillus sp.]|nr:ribose 5-phosphate isomerase B [Alicyclobacillus sp.]